MICFRFALISLVAVGIGEVSAADNAIALTEARKALRERLPQVAVQKVRKILAGPELAQDERAQVTLLLSEGLIDSAQPEEALEQLRTMPATDAGDLLRARALVMVGRWGEALEIYQAEATRRGPTLVTLFGETECLVALERKSDASAVLQKAIDSGINRPALKLRLAEICIDLQQLGRARQLIQSAAPMRDSTAVSHLDKKWATYVEGRIYLAENQPLPAMEIFEELLRDFEKTARTPANSSDAIISGALSDALLFGATLGLTEARIAMEGYSKVHPVLERFINSFPQSAYLEVAFRRLDQIYHQADDPTEERLHKWAQQLPARRAALATFYVARLTLRERKEENYQKADDLLQYFARTYPSHPRLCDAYLLLADIYIFRGMLDSAVSVLEAAMRSAESADQRGEIELRTGIVHHQQGEFLLAASLFRSAAERAPRLRLTATYNAALAWLNQRNDERFADELRNLSGLPGSGNLQNDLLLEQGLVQARNGELRAEETLQLFLHQNPRHPRAGEARVALAELAYQALQASASPAQQQKSAEQAAEYLRVANTESRTPETAAHADYLAVFLADAETPRNDARVIELGQEFLRRHKQSPLVSDVRMKLGQVYFRSEDFPNAETQFATLAEESPNSSYAETALFLAGKSAMGLAMNPGALDRALGFFDRVVRRDGQLKLYARQEQAIAQSQVGHEEEAILLYELILSTPSANPELRYAALCGKGNNLLKLGRKMAVKLEAATAVFDQLANAPNVTPSWRNQALYKKAKALEQLGRTPEALEAFYDLLDRSASSEREHFWSGKAGFEAGHLLEQQEQWKAAISIYEKLAKLEGPRATEARSRVRQLRLEHFVWE